MGRYFGIFNVTRKQAVSGYWKGDSFCDCCAVMHQFGWKPTDKIFSQAYDSAYIFRYDPKENIIITDLMWPEQGCENYEIEDTEEYDNDEKKEEYENDEIEQDQECENDDIEETEEKEYENDEIEDTKIEQKQKCENDEIEEYSYYGFEPKLSKEMYDHIPKFNGSICEICGYEVKDPDLYKDKFDEVFFAN